MVGSSKNVELFRESAGGASRQGGVPNSSGGSGAEGREWLSASETDAKGRGFFCVGSGGISRYRNFEVPGQPGNRVVPR